MSDEQSPSQPSGAPPIPAIAKQAPGVTDARQAPSGATLATGDIIGNRYMVSRYLGSSDGSTNYLCRDQKRQRDTVLKLIPTQLLDAKLNTLLAEQIKLAAQLGQHKNISSVYGMGQASDSHAFVAVEFLDGYSLSRLVAKRREQGRNVDMRDIFTVIAHCANVLQLVHKHTTHGVLTPYNLYVSRQGVLKLNNLAFGRVTALMLHEQQKGPFHDSIYVAPEVHDDPDSLSPASDVYSLAMIAVDLLNPKGLPADRQMASRAISKVLADHPPKLTQFLLSALDVTPNKRPSLADFVRVFEDTARQSGVLLGHPPAEGQLPIEPAVAPEAVEQTSNEEEEEEDLFNIPGLKESDDDAVVTSSFDDFDDDEDEGRYLVQKDGLDYGPFTVEQVLTQLKADEIDENTSVLDRFTQKRKPLIDVGVFTEEVKAYIPIREARLKAEAERRAELQRKVKKGGQTVFVVGIFVGLCVLAGMIYVIANQPDPEPLPMDKAFASLDYKLLPPPKEFKTVKVDSDLMKSIFDPAASEEEIAKKLKKFKRKRRGRTGGRRPANGSKANGNVTEVDMSGSGGTKRILSDGEIYEVIMTKFGSMRRCIVKELGTNPSFKGVTVKFFIRPSGTTGGVKIKESAYNNKAVGNCLKSRFRAIKFPSHSGFNRGVTFPLYVK